MYNNLSFYRKQLHLTQEQLSSLSGISQSIISDLENDKIEYPSLYTAYCLCYILDRDIEDVFHYNMSSLRLRKIKFFENSFKGN